MISWGTIRAAIEEKVSVAASDEGGGLRERLELRCAQGFASLLRRSAMGVIRVGIVHMGMILNAVFERMLS